jgi:RHS repeat-associated protein
MRIEMVEDVNNEEEGIIFGAATRKLTGLEVGKKYEASFEIQTDGTSQLKQVNVGVFANSLFSMGILGEENQESIELDSMEVIDADSITLRFTATESDMVIFISGNARMATPYHYNIDNFNLRKGFETIVNCDKSNLQYADGDGRYRFGFNGKENDSEVEGQQDYGLRIYDRRLGRFKSPDPLIVQNKMYPELSTYQFASNTPIAAIDLDGAEAEIVVHKMWKGSDRPIIETQTYRYTDIGWHTSEVYAKYGNQKGNYGTMIVFESVDQQQAVSIYKMTTTEKISKFLNKKVYPYFDNPKEGIAFTSSLGQNGETKRSSNSFSENIDGFILNMYGAWATQ